MDTSELIKFLKQVKNEKNELCQLNQKCINAESYDDIEDHEWYLDEQDLAQIISFIIDGYKYRIKIND